MGESKTPVEATAVTVEIETNTSLNFQDTNFSMWRGELGMRIFFFFNIGET